MSTLTKTLAGSIAIISGYLYIIDPDQLGWLIAFAGWLPHIFKE